MLHIATRGKPAMSRQTMAQFRPSFPVRSGVVRQLRRHPWGGLGWWAWLIGRGWRVSVRGRSTGPGRLLHDRRHVWCQGEGRQAGSRGGRQVSDSNRAGRLRGGVRRMVSSKMAKDMDVRNNKATKCTLRCDYLTLFDIQDLNQETAQKES